MHSSGQSKDKSLFLAEFRAHAIKDVKDMILGVATSKIT
jgi:hypothetical protein